MKRIALFSFVFMLLLCLTCSARVLPFNVRIKVYDEYGEEQIFDNKYAYIARCIEKETGENIELDRTYTYPDDSVILDLDYEIRDVIFSEMNDNFVTAIELKNNDENNPYPEVNPFEVRIRNDSMFDSPERASLFGKDYRVYYLENNMLNEIDIITSSLHGLDFEAEKLGVYIIYFNPNVHNVKFFTDETLAEEFHEAKNLKYNSTFDFPEPPTREGYAFTGWKHYHWLKRYDAYLTFDRAVVSHAFEVFASWYPEEEYTPLEITIESKKTIKKGKEDGCEIFLTLSEGRFEDVIGWYPNAQWKIIGNDELSIEKVERIDDTTAKITLSGNSSDKYTANEIQIEFNSTLYLSHGKENDSSETHEIADIQLDENGIKRKWFVSDNSITLEKQKRGGNGGGVEKHTITFETNGGEEVQSVRVANGHTLGAPERVLKEGYVFAGWYIDKELTTSYDFENSVTESFTLYAAWEKPTENEQALEQIVLPIKIIEKAIELLKTIIK